MRHKIVLISTTFIGLGALLAASTASADDEQYVQSPANQQYTQTPTNQQYVQTQVNQQYVQPPAEQRYVNRPFAAPSNAFELQLSTGYTQGFGNIFPNTPILRIAGAGLGFTGSLGYRMSAHASLDFEGQYQVFTAENSNTAQGLATNLGITMHATPESRGDPWLRLGSGWRAVWQSTPTERFGFVNGNNTNMYHGWDIVTARIGIDFRSSSGVAWAPIVGADVQSFFWENGTQLPTAQIGTFVYAGLQGRFDIGGTTNSSNVAYAR